MKNFKLICSVIFLCACFAASAQYAPVTYTAKTLRVTGYPCNGQANYSSFTFTSDNENTTEVSSGCQTGEGSGNPGGTNYAENTSSVTRTNTSSEICSRMTAWEDNTGSRCFFDAGDGCYVASSFCVDFREYPPGNDPDDWAVYNGQGQNVH